MRASKSILGLSILIALATTVTSAQKQFIQTVTTQNTACNYGCSLMDVPGTISNPELNENPAAIILATQVSNLNPHTVAAYYRAYEKKWSLFNVDGFNIVPNAKYNVEYWANPGPNQFVYIAPFGSPACIDHPGLNDKPNALVRIFPTANPALGGLFNRNEVKIEYDATARKWCVGNKLPNLVFPGGTAYNIVISSPTPLPAMNTGTFVPLPTPTPGSAGLPGTQILPSATLAPKENTGGDPVATTATPTAAKPYVLFFNQNGIMEYMMDANVNTQPISGMDNQVFKVDQSSRVVFHTITLLDIRDPFQINATGVWLLVEILNSSNVMVARSTSYGWLKNDTPQNLNSTGIGILPAGTYHTRVVINRQPGGAILRVMTGGFAPISGYVQNGTQGSQMIIEIFPD